MTDLNGLKLVNDACGYRTGDVMLQKAAAILQKACRKEDITAPWGGDAFVILLPKINPAVSFSETLSETESNMYQNKPSIKKSSRRTITGELFYAWFNSIWPVEYL